MDTGHPRVQRGRLTLLLLLSGAFGPGCACTPMPVLDEGGLCGPLPGGFRCHYNTATLVTDHGTREVHFALPRSDDGGPPPGGWPTVIAFQGSFFPAELYFTSDSSMAFGGEYQGQTVRALLEQGFAVVAPEAQVNGNQYWDTNLVHRNVDWETTPDHALMLALFRAIEAGNLGALDETRLFAMGISSGGYMTSRMAVSYPGRFARLAIVSASHAVCGGIYCPVPDTLPEDHPPTLFLHGRGDVTTPLLTMERYADALEDQGTEVEVVIDDGAGHGWIEGSADHVTAFFTRP
jgi:dienelactone hydrolase